MKSSQTRFGIMAALLLSLSTPGCFTFSGDPAVKTAPGNLVAAERGEEGNAVVRRSDLPPVKPFGDAEGAKARRYQELRSVGGPGPKPVDIETLLPPEARAQVEANLNYFTGRGRRHFEKWLGRSTRYLPMMHRTFQAYGLPPDLVYLSMIESGYNPTVVSRAKAVGIWQFIRGTGRRYGLEISRYVDERRDPEKATHAAAQYLRDLYILFRSWDLALASYNAGEGKIGRSVRRHATDNFWEIRKTSYLKRETRDYVPKYLAALTIAKNPAKYGFHNIDYQRPVASERVTVTGGLSLSALAKVCGVSKKEMQALNPELRRSLTPPGSAYVLRVPPGTGGAVLDNMVALAKASRKESRIAASGDHRVRPGQTLSSIARRYGVSTRSLARANNMDSTDILRSGRKLKIPGYSVRAKGHGRPGIHVVKRGETLGSIARRYGVTIRALARANNMRTTSVLRIGRKLNVPGGSRGGRRESA